MKRAEPDRITRMNPAEKPSPSSSRERPTESTSTVSATDRTAPKVMNEPAAKARAACLSGPEVRNSSACSRNWLTTSWGRRRISPRSGRGVSQSGHVSPWLRKALPQVSQMRIVIGLALPFARTRGDGHCKYAALYAALYPPCPRVPQHGRPRSSPRST